MGCNMMIKKIFLPMLTAAVLALNAAEVGSVKFIQEGGNPIPESILNVSLRLRPGMEFKPEYMDEDLKTLFNSGRVSDAAAEYTAGKDGKINLVYRIKPSPVISVFKLAGNKKFSTKDLQKCLKIADGDRLNSRALSESIEELRKFYIGKGYTDVRIAPPTVVPDGKGGVIVTVTIEENLRLKVHEVRFEGVEVFKERDLRAVMFNRFSYWNWVPFVSKYLNSGLLDRNELVTDRARLRELYHDKGYLDFKIKDIKINPLADDPEYVDLTVMIEEGKPYTLDKITISGTNDIDAKELMPLVKMAAGEVYSLAKETASVKAMMALYDARGYTDIIVRPVLSVDHPNHKVSVDFNVAEGRKYFVRDVIIVGNTNTKDKVLRRELAIQPGDPVAKNRINISRQRLMGMGYFTKVEAEAINADALNEKDVRITVEERPDRYNFRLGVGASDVNSVFGMAEISTGNFDITNPRNWFYGGGQRLRLQGIYGIDNAGFNVDFVEPWLLDLPLRFELSGYMNTAEYDDWDEERIGVRTSLQRKIFDDFTTVAVGYKFEIVRVFHINHRLKSYMKENDLDGTSRVSQFSLMLNRDTRDSLVNPTEGYNINLFGAISPKALGSSSDFYRLEAKGSYFANFFDKAIVWMVGAKLGVVAGFNYRDETPVYERYFLGGSDSLRGFEYRSVGHEINGKNVGGQTMLVLTTEVSHPIWGPLRGAAFVDAGNAWRRSYNMDLSEFNIGVGYGLRLKLPMIQAPLKLDFAFPILRSDSDMSKKLRIHFNVGFTF
ncbi:MAG: outer membrane protein assembly factor BamA [Lentisphaerae bacterium]|nr:outer membrane protein assembly factor BamA [Lentisphaerota bacterium]